MSQPPQFNTLNVIRWILVIPAGFLGWFIALILGTFLYSVVNSLCPPESIISSLCQAPWYGPAIDGIMIFSVGLSAVLVVLLPTLVALQKRSLIAAVSYVSGFFVAIYAVYETSAWAEFISAIISGGITLYFVLRYLKTKNNAQA